MAFNEEEFRAVIATWEGVPYLHAGRTKSAGIDCVNFVVCVYEDLGVFERGEIKYAPYPPDWHMHQAEERILNITYDYCFEIAKYELRYGDLILMQFGKCFSHGALFVEDQEIIHSIVKRGVVRSSLTQRYWKNRAHKYFRLRDL